MALPRLARVARFVALAFAVASPAVASVLVVAPSGASFTSIQAAVDAAAEGDTILVKPGSYAGFQVTAKSLSIVADPEGSVLLTTPAIVASIAAGQHAVLCGLRFSPQFNGAVRASQNAGTLRFEALSCAGGPASTLGHALVVSGSADVAILRSLLTGGDSGSLFPSQPGSGLVVTSSNVALYDTQVSGGNGSNAQYVGSGGSSHPALPGAAGASVDGTTTLFASGSQIVGGRGGKGLSGICFPFVSGGGAGAPGGTGAVVASAAQLFVVDSQTTGGAGGPGGSGAAACSTSAGARGPAGADIVGSASTVAGTRRTLACATHVRELTTLPVTATGVPGDQVWVRIGHAADWTLDLPFAGVRLFAPSARRALLGSIPGSGTLDTSLFFPDLGPGVESQTWHMQGLFRESGGNVRLGSGAVITVLDAAF